MERKFKEIIIVGPTCTGKTSLGIKLCHEFNGSIISADSRQVVKYMDIGTGKVPVGINKLKTEKSDNFWLIDRVEIFGYDLVNPDEYFSSFDFASYCKRVVPSIVDANRTVFIIGGSGFYIDLLTGKISLDSPEPDFELRMKLDPIPTDELAQKLLEIDSVIYHQIDLSNRARVLRAVEIALTNKKKDKTPPILSKPVYIGLISDRDTLYNRADNWVESIFTDDLFQEAQFIKDSFPLSHRLKGIIYKSAISYLNGFEGFDDAKQRTKYDLHSYIRRQQTWFKRNKEITWFDISQKNFDSEAISYVKSVLDG